ncbi:MAG: hypothetical protein EOO20_04505 [Chryseobacterium sp.]|nr:MAG: hypothetical protein EOO20_04505 [Chryseobacterium sp.]
MEFDFNSIHLYQWELLYSVDMEAQLGIWALRKLMDNQERSLLEAEEEFSLQVKKELAGMDKREADDYFFQVLNEDRLVLRELRKQQRYSLCVSLFNFFEARMSSLRTMVALKFNGLQAIKQNQAESIIRWHWRYLVGTYGIDTDTTLEDFEVIHSVKVLRNLITHHDGVLKERDLRKMPQGIAGVEVLSLGEVFELQITDLEFFKDLFDRMERFFKALLKSIDERAGSLDKK